MTGLPMVFAVWAAGGSWRRVRGGSLSRIVPLWSRADRADCRLRSATARISAALVREYLTRHIVHELESREYEGMELFLRYAGNWPKPARQACRTPL